VQAGGPGCSRCQHNTTPATATAGSTEQAPCTHAHTHRAGSAQPTPISRMWKQETSYKKMSSHEAPVSGTQASRRQSRLPSLNLLLSTQTFNHLKLSSHLSQRRQLSVILSSINISQQSQLMQISSKNAPVCSTLISTVPLPPSDHPRLRFKPCA